MIRLASWEGGPCPPHFLKFPETTRVINQRDRVHFPILKIVFVS